MQQQLHPADWNMRAQDGVVRAGCRCEACGIPHGVLRVGNKSTAVVSLQDGHVDHDPQNPQAELRALCPSCHLTYDRRTERTQTSAHRQGEQVVRTRRLLVEMQHESEDNDGMDGHFPT